MFRPRKNAYVFVTEAGEKIKIMKRAVFEQFNPNILGLGDIAKSSSAKNAICAVFDLQGFTNFCKQIDPQLSVPLYLSNFLSWIFHVIRAETVRKKFKEGIKLWHDLPFCTKFLGDGLLILWDTSDMELTAQHNLIVSMDSICDRYISEFLPVMKKKVCDPPIALRCGMTKGIVYSVGDGKDFVGPCINLAARLENLPGVRFAFARRGFDPESHLDKKVIPDYVLKKVAIRGMENEEIIYIRKKDFEEMEEKDQAFYRDP